MRKYSIKSMNTGSNKVYTITFWDGEKHLSSMPIRYYKTKKGAERERKKRENFSF